MQQYKKIFFIHSILKKQFTYWFSKFSGMEFCPKHREAFFNIKYSKFKRIQRFLFVDDADGPAADVTHAPPHSHRHWSSSPFVHAHIWRPRPTIWRSRSMPSASFWFVYTGTGWTITAAKQQLRHYTWRQYGQPTLANLKLPKFMIFIFHENLPISRLKRIRHFQMWRFQAIQHLQEIWYVKDITFLMYFNHDG